MESGSFSYLRNSVCNTYGIPRNSAEFRLNFTVKIPRNSAKFRGIPCVFQKIPYSAGSKKSTSVDTLGSLRTALFVLLFLYYSKFLRFFLRLFYIYCCLSLPVHKLFKVIPFNAQTLRVMLCHLQSTYTMLLFLLWILQFCCMLFMLTCHFMPDIGEAFPIIILTAA